MILALLLAAAAPQSAVEAEREFAARAQTEGLWTAFRATAAADAVMFVPHRVNAQQWLTGRKDPLLGYMWWPAKSWVSCDGTLAATTGPSVLGNSRNYFTTIWARQSDGGWKWLLDHGDVLEAPRAAGESPQVKQASCSGMPPPTAHMESPDMRRGYSPDRTLHWSWHVMPGNSRRVAVMIWNGSDYETVIDDRIRSQ